MQNNSSDEFIKLNEAYEDGLFRLVMNEVAEAEGQSLLEENKALNIDPENLPTEKDLARFEKLLNAHLKKARRKKQAPKILRRTLVAVASVVIVFSTMMLTVQAFRIQVLNFLINIEPKYTSLGLNSSNNDQSSGKLVVNWANAYMPTYIPKGYKIGSISSTESTKKIVFNNLNNDSTVLYTDYISPYSIAIDTEGASLIQSIIISGQEGTLAVKGSTTTVAWKIDDHLFTIQGQLSTDEVTKMAEGVKFFK